MDAHSQQDELVKNDFLSSLEDLTINSKPVITALTMLAAEHTKFYGPVAEAIMEHFDKVERY